MTTGLTGIAYSNQSTQPLPELWQWIKRHIIHRHRPWWR